MYVENVIHWTQILLAVSLLLQSFEMWAIANWIGDSTPWAWSGLKKGVSYFPNFLKTALDFLYLDYFKVLVLAQFVLILILPLSQSGLVITGLIITTVLICFRFRGVFNGGSDYMTLTVLFGLFFSSLNQNDPLLVRYGLLYIALQCTLSYFIAGIVKVRTPAWRSGLALRAFIKHSNYPVPTTIRQWVERPILMFVASWVVMLWECTFPLIWLWPKFVFGYLAVAILFHLGVFISFGLNRFVFAWLASYPALIYGVSQNY